MLSAVGIAAYALMQSARGRAAAGWPTAAGTVTSTRIDEKSALKGGFFYTPVILYRYTVAGMDYHGDRIAFGDMSGSHLEAEKMLQSYPVGSAIHVHYNPGRPEESVLQTGPDKYLVGTIIGACIFFGAGCLMLLIGWSRSH